MQAIMYMLLSNSFDAAGFFNELLYTQCTEYLSASIYTIQHNC